MLRLRIGERQKRESLSPVELGDDTRRPATELSGARVEKNRTRQ
jgi:hypothetical protein